MAITGNNTAIFMDSDGYTKVILHKTCIVKFNHETITLNHGGYVTKTTFKRMNEVSYEYNLDFRVFTKAGKTFVTHNNQTREFTENEITLPLV